MLEHHHDCARLPNLRDVLEVVLWDVHAWDRNPSIVTIQDFIPFPVNLLQEDRSLCVTSDRHFSLDFHRRPLSGARCPLLQASQGY